LTSTNVELMHAPRHVHRERGSASHSDGLPNRDHNTSFERYVEDFVSRLPNAAAAQINGGLWLTAVTQSYVVIDRALPRNRGSAHGEY
jgi:hypothetical protein